MQMYSVFPWSVTELNRTKKKWQAFYLMNLIKVKLQSGTHIALPSECPEENTKKYTYDFATSKCLSCGYSL